MSKKTVLALVGSLRAGSTNRQLAETAVQLAPEGVDVTSTRASADMPFYNEDIDVEGRSPPRPSAARSRRRRRRLPAGHPRVQRHRSRPF